VPPPRYYDEGSIRPSRQQAHPPDDPFLTDLGHPSIGSFTQPRGETVWKISEGKHPTNQGIATAGSYRAPRVKSPIYLAPSEA
jgi:hypothetical protein